MPVQTNTVLKMVIEHKLSKIRQRHHSHFNLKSNYDMAIPNAWNRLRGCLNSSAKVFSSILPKTIKFGAFSSSLGSQLSSVSMKFLIEACFTLPPKLRAQDLSRQFHRGCLFLRLMTVGGWKVLRLSSSVNLYISKSQTFFMRGTTAFSFLGPFMPRKLLQYSIYAMETLKFDRSMSLLGCWPWSQSWQIEPAALPLSFPRQEGLFFSIYLVRLMQQLQPMQPRWFQQKRIGLWSYPMAWQYSLNPLAYRLKNTKELYPQLRGVQTARFLSALLNPAWLRISCMNLQLSADFWASTFFFITIYCIVYWSFPFSSSSSCSPSCLFKGSSRLSMFNPSSTVSSEKFSYTFFTSLNCSSLMSSSESIIFFLSRTGLFLFLELFSSLGGSSSKTFGFCSTFSTQGAGSSMISSSPKSTKLFCYDRSLSLNMFCCNLCGSNMSSVFSSILFLYSEVDSSITPTSFSSSLSINSFLSRSTQEEGYGDVFA